MKIILGLIIFAVFTTLSAYADDSQFIPWSENSKLVWNDFNGTAHVFPKEYLRPDPNAIAFTWGNPKLVDFNYELVPSIKCQYQITSVHAVGFFDKKQSWTTEQAKLIPITLIHEQGHFDIIEVYARKIESGLLFKVVECPNEGFNKPIINSTINANAEAIAKETQKMHDEYDAGIKSKSSSQQEWNSRIASDLQKYQVKSTSRNITVGIGSEKTDCFIGWKIMQKNSNDKLYCVTPTTSLFLEKRGWGKTMELPQLN